MSDIDILESWIPKEKVGEVSEEDLQKLQDSLKKAKQIRQQIKKQKIEDYKIAFMLEQLVKFINNDFLLNLILQIYEKDVRNLYYIFSIVFPFIRDKVNIQILKDLDIIWLDFNIQINSVSDFVDFFRKNDKLVWVTTDEKAKLVFEIIKEFNIWQIISVLNNKDNKQRQRYISELEKTILAELSWYNLEIGKWWIAA